VLHDRHLAGHRSAEQLAVFGQRLGVCQRLAVLQPRLPQRPHQRDVSPPLLPQCRHVPVGVHGELSCRGLSFRDLVHPSLQRLKTPPQLHDPAHADIRP
jgi:hypothetical protein